MRKAVSLIFYMVVLTYFHRRFLVVRFMLLRHSLHLDAAQPKSVFDLRNIIYLAREIDFPGLCFANSQNLQKEPIFWKLNLLEQDFFPIQINTKNSHMVNQ